MQSLFPIENPEVRCHNCQYSLCGLPYQGRCPECGTRYEYTGDGIREAERAFARSLPRLLRIPLDGWVGRHLLVVMPLLLLVAIAAASIIYPYLLVGASAVGCWLDPSPSPQRSNGFIECGMYGTYGKRIIVNHKVISIGAPYLFVVQLIMVAIIWFWYTWSGRRNWLQRILMSRAGLHAAFTVPVTLLFLSVPVGVWQAVNVMNPTCFGYRYLRTMVRNGLSGRDPLLWIGLLGIALLSVGVAIYLVRCHRKCIRAMRDACSGVRMIDDE